MRVWLVVALAACGGSGYREPPMPKGTPVTSTPLDCTVPYNGGSGFVIASPDRLHDLVPDCTATVDFSRQSVVVVREGEANGGNIYVGAFQRRGDVLDVELHISPTCASGMDRGEGRPKLFVVEATGISQVIEWRRTSGPQPRGCPGSRGGPALAKR